MRWRYVILGVAGVCALLGLIATLLMTPKYTAVASIEISREADQVTNFQGVEREAVPPTRNSTRRNMDCWHRVRWLNGSPHNYGLSTTRNSSKWRVCRATARHSG